MNIEIMNKVREALEEMKLEVEDSLMRTREDAKEPSYEPEHIEGEIETYESIIKLVEERINLYDIPSPAEMWDYLKTQGWIIDEDFESNNEYKFLGKADDMGNTIILVIPRKISGNWEERILSAINLICAIKNKTYEEVMEDINNV